MDRVTDRLRSDVTALKSLQNTMEDRIQALEKRIAKLEPKRGRPRKEAQDGKDTSKQPTECS